MLDTAEAVPDSLERFRKLTGHPRRNRGLPARPPVPLHERALVALLLTNIAWLVFSVGGIRLWGLSTAMVLSVATLLMLLFQPADTNRGNQKPVFRLLRNPLFWIGFGLYTYMFFQSWNLAWEWTLGQGGKPKLVAVQPLVSWLPTGLGSPLNENNPLRSMMFYTIPWISCSVAWVGLTSRRAILFLLNALAWIGVIFAGIALYQHFLGIDRILGIFPTVPSKVNYAIPFWGTLINENHAAFYLVLITGLCLGLFMNGWDRDRRQTRRKGGAWLLYLDCAFLTSYAVLMAQARGAIIGLAILWFMAITICSISFLRYYGSYGLILPGALILMVAFLVLAFVINPTTFNRQKREWIRTFDLVENPQLESRYYLMQISLDMIGEHPWKGQGAGCFRYLHLPKLADYPELRTHYYHWEKNKKTGNWEKVKQTIWYQYAHVDILEYIIEWGFIGCLFPISALAWLISVAIRNRRSMNPGHLVILMAVLIVFMAAAIEFHLRIPLVLLSWSLTFTGTVRLCELEAGLRKEPLSHEIPPVGNP